MREGMVGRARVAVLRTAAKSAVLREKSRAGEDALQDFPFRTNIGLIQARACAAKRFHPTSLAGCLVAVAWRRCSRLFRAESCGNFRENLCYRAALKGYEYTGPSNPRQRTCPTQDDRTMAARVARGKKYHKLQGAFKEARGHHEQPALRA